MENQSDKIKRSIFDFFDFDISKIPDESYVEGPIEKNQSDVEIRTYRKNLNNKLFDLFDSIEVIVIGDSKNVFFKTYDTQLSNLDPLKKLIDNLYLVYGPDDMDKGKFNPKDIEAFYVSDIYSLFGRNWQEHNKFKFPVAITRDENEISFGIWGVQKDKN